MTIYSNNEEPFDVQNIEQVQFNNELAKKSSHDVNETESAKLLNPVGNFFNYDAKATKFRTNNHTILLQQQEQK